MAPRLAPRRVPRALLSARSRRLVMDIERGPQTVANLDSETERGVIGHGEESTWAALRTEAATTRQSRTRPVLGTCSPRHRSASPPRVYPRNRPRLHPTAWPAGERPNPMQRAGGGRLHRRRRREGRPFHRPGDGPTVGSLHDGRSMGLRHDDPGLRRSRQPLRLMSRWPASRQDPEGLVHGAVLVTVDIPAPRRAICRRWARRAAPRT